jgi:hypothetical protein
MSEPAYLAKVEAAALCDVSPSTIQRYRHSGSQRLRQQQP